MLTLKNVNKIYNFGKENECAALRDINLRFPSRGFVFIEGQSGSGKTTLLNIIAGIDIPTSGEIENPYGDNFCSVIFQDFQLIDILTVEENLKLVTDMTQISSQEFDALLEKYALKEILTHYPNQISGGQKQCVAIMRAILQNRQVIVCDEPTGNLDEDNSVKIAELLKSEAADKLVIVVSHDVELFEPYCDRHIKLKKGKVEKDETISDPAGDKGKQTVGQNREFRLSFGKKVLLSWRFLRKRLVKNILMAISLFLSVLILFSALNGLCNTESSIIYHVYKNAKMDSVDFALKDRKYTDQYCSMSKAEYAEAESKYGNVTPFVDFGNNSGYRFENFSVNRLYVAEACDRKLLCGDASTEGGKMIISDHLADILKEKLGKEEYGELLNEPLNSGGTLVLGGVFQTGALYGKESIYTDPNDFYKIAYISRSDLSNLSGDSCFVFIELNGQRHGIEDELSCNASSRKVLYGEQTELQRGEIGITEEAAKKFTDTVEDLIGQTITIDFFNVRGRLNQEQIDKTEKQFTVKYIFRGSLWDMDVSEADFQELVGGYSATIYGYNVWGLSLKGYSEKGVQRLVSAGFTDYTYLSDGIKNGASWLGTLYWFELALGGLLLLISVIIVCNHVVASVEKERRTLGVLVSLGIKVKATVLIYLFSVFVILFSCIALAAVGEIFVIGLVNRLIVKNGLSPVKILFFQPSALLIILCIGGLLSALIYLILLGKLKKKQIADIIYER